MTVPLRAAAGARLRAGCCAAPPPTPTSISNRSTAPARSPRSSRGTPRPSPALEKQPGFADYRARALALLSTNQKIAEPDQILGDKVLNFWQDEQHPRGLWRVSPLAAFAAGQPQWRTLLDIDVMSKADNKKWVFKGAACLSPAYVDCMVSLSNGGGDAVEVREFDLDKAAFIPGGFTLPTAKTERLVGRARRACSSAPTSGPAR